MFLTKSEEEKTTNKATLVLKKNRQGCLCGFESFYFNNGTLQIDMSVGTTSADVEQAIADFGANKSKSWDNVHSELQKHYVTSQNQSLSKQEEVITPTEVLSPVEFVNKNTSGVTSYNEFSHNEFYDCCHDEWTDNF